MNYIALLRGINVGGKRKVEMVRLRHLFESLDYRDVTTYINSGNVFFESDEKQGVLQDVIHKALEQEFGFEIPTLIKTKTQIQKIADFIPRQWENNSEQKTDVAYLFSECDFEEIIEELPLKREYIEVLYTKGALIWNVQKKNLNKSHLAKLATTKLYKSMTVRNANTARFLAGKSS